MSTADTEKKVSGEARQIGGQLLWGACVAGSLETVKILEGAFGLAVEDFLAQDAKAFRLAFKRGHFELAAWLHERHPVPAAAAKRGRCSLLMRALFRGDVAAALWFASAFKVVDDDLPSVEGMGTLAWLPLFGKLPVVRFLLGNPEGGLLGPAKRHQIFLIYARKICAQAQLSTLEDALTTYRDLVDPAEVFRWSCLSGELLVPEWLVEKFHPSLSRPVLICVFASACSRGHLPLAQWLAEHFALTREEVRCGDLAIGKAHKRGREAVVTWLRAKFY